MPPQGDKPALEGLRVRKRRETRERIINSALQLFLERGFDAVTVDEIATVANVSKRSFFDYFPSKEEVIVAWQDHFGEALALAVEARPAGEPLTRTVEEAMIASISAAMRPEALAVEDLIRNTPVLRERESVKYARLEQTLAQALQKRARGERGRFRAQLLAAVIISGLRLGNEEWHKRGKTDFSRAQAFIRKIFRQVWEDLRWFGDTALQTKAGDR